jgi:D-3-phosphoglycerate dehydrogenase / 2-oxoglutarate reductase
MSSGAAHEDRDTGIAGPPEDSPVVLDLTGYREPYLRQFIAAGLAELAPAECQGAGFEIRHVDKSASESEIRSAARPARVVISDTSHTHFLGTELLSAFTNCRLVQVPTVGYDDIDVAAAAGLGIPVANLPEWNREAVADWTVMAMIALLRNSVSWDRRMREGQEEWFVRSALGRELSSCTVGILGLGNVGGAVARRLTGGFGSEVLYHDIRPRKMPGAKSVDFAELLERSQILSVHVPLDASTRGIIGEAALSAVPLGACLVNAARGGIVDEHALIDALDRGHLAGAALDVFDREPLPAGSVLRRREDILLSPHAAASTVQARQRQMAMLGANVALALANRHPQHIVNGLHEPGKLTA